MESRAVLRHIVVSTLAVATIVSSSIASAQSPAARVRTLDEQALAAYHELDLARADELLGAALEIALSEGVTGADLARVHLTRGVIAVAGHGDRARGVDAFMAALQADPAAQVDVSLSTPEVQSAFATAQQRTAGGGRAGTTSAVRDSAITGTPAPSVPSGTTVTPATRTPASTTPSDAAAPQCQADGDCATGESCHAGQCVSRVQRPRFFLQLGGVFGVHHAGRGMLADDSPPSGGDPARYASYVMPGNNGCEAEPGEYCVRVTNAGVVPVFGVRATIGYWLSSRIAIAGMVRLGLAGGNSALSFGMIGPRLYVLLTRPSTSRFSLSALFGGALGQTQVRPKQSSTMPGVTVERPWAQTGLASIQVGAVAEVRLVDHVALFASVEGVAFFPNANFGIDVTAGPQFMF